MMLRLLLTFLACLMCFSGTFAQKKRRKTAARTPRQAQVIFADFPLKVSKNNAYLTDQANRPFLMNADAGWLLLQKLTIEEARYYLNNRKAKYFNTVFLQLLPTEPDQKNAYGEVPFLKQGDFSTPNEKYFNYVEEVLKAANRLGMAVALVPAWLGCCRTNWYDVQYQNGVEKCQRYGQYLATRLKAHKNIVWIMGGDRDPLREESVQRAIAEGIKSITPTQPMTYHAASSHSSTDVFGSENWLDFSMVYTYFRGKQGVWTPEMPQVYEVAKKEYQKIPRKAFILGESQYEDENVGNDQMMRRQVYWAMLSGGAGHCYGSSLWAFPANWRRVLNLSGATDMAFFHRIFTRLPWELLRPELKNELIVAGQGTYGSDDYAPVATLPNSRLAVVYLPVGRTIQIDASKIKGSSIRALWINPSTDKRWIGGYFKPTGIRDLTPPSLGNDWILLLGNVGKK
ncbi:MAG: DUF4038 domain-containing protein [Cytophagia bacterium]|nr:MAG: DUF4038 domain-containing protein [Runella sp.]TAG19124.1 MAG: DUF4038 domain-containing protein [Cytophagales bacterium]TAG38405.1 MAG: DUF4038 domain-containing protein [Cytophagia bacterium]TAG52777.1 MAG: DUF4038 domain-containing protein [Runella slithyformis]TAG79979.1 MAG: DUF4038 domain-containing protein [Cytophagales bacterium]